MQERIREAMRDVVGRHQLPGIAVAVVRGESLVFCEAVGFAEIESKEPFSPERRQRIASITKTMVSLCTLALCDEKKLSLSSVVPGLLPELRFHGPAERMTVRHLLTHTSGIGEAVTREGLRDVANPNRAGVGSPGDFATLHPAGITVEVEPGSKFAYCNPGFALLGEIVERAEGTPLHEVMQRRIFGPLGMTSTDLLDENDARISACYHRAPSEDTRFQLERAGIPVKDEPTVDGVNVRGAFTADFNRGMRAAGGVQSNLPDMARYAAALLRRGAGIVRPETFDAMVAPVVGDDPRFIGWGLGFARRPLRTGAAGPAGWGLGFGHGGAYFGGWNSSIDVLPHAGLAVVQHTNVMLDDSGPAFRPVLRAVLDVPPPVIAEASTDAALLDAAPGAYELPMPGPLTNFRPQTRTGRVRVERAGRELVIHARFGPWKRGARLVPVDPADPGFFAVPVDEAEPLYLRLVRDAAGAVTELRMEDLVRMLRVGD